MLTKELTKGIRKRGNSWQFSLMVNGQRVERTAKTFEEAMKERKETKEALKAGKDILSLHKKEFTQQYTLRHVFELACEQNWKNSKSEKTAIINATAALDFFGRLTNIHDLTTEWIWRYVSHLEDKGNSNATINRKLSALSLMFRIAKENGIINDVPVMRKRKEPKGRDRYLTPLEEEKMLEITKAWEFEGFQDIIIMLLDTGCRKGELLKLQKQDVNLEQGKRGIVSFYETKNSKPRSVPITQRVRAIIEQRLIHIEGDALFPYSESWIRTHWGRLKYIMGLIDDRQFIPHMLRHTCASRLVQNGVPLYTVQAWLGHVSPLTTSRYAHLSPTTLETAADVLNNLQG